MTAINDVTKLEVIENVGVITLNSPPVNALSANVREGLDSGMKIAIENNNIDAIVIICEGRTFIAGADISEFGKEPKGPAYEAYILAAVWRDGLQKGLFMHPGANTKEVIDAFERMMANKESRKYLISKLGDYPMYFGKDSEIIMNSLYSYVTKERLRYLVDFAANNMEWSTATYVEGKTID